MRRRDYRRQESEITFKSNSYGPPKASTHRPFAYDSLSGALSWWSESTRSQSCPEIPLLNTAASVQKFQGTFSNQSMTTAILCLVAPCSVRICAEMQIRLGRVVRQFVLECVLRQFVCWSQASVCWCWDLEWHVRGKGWRIVARLDSLCALASRLVIPSALLPITAVLNGFCLDVLTRAHPIATVALNL